MNASTRNDVLATVLLALVIALPGCSGDEDLDATARPAASDDRAATTTDAAAAKPPTPTTKPNRAQAPIKPADNIVSVEEQLRVTIELPDYYPADGPVYPDAKPSQAQQQPNGKVSLIFGTAAPVEEASRVMIEVSEAKGWTVIATDEFDGGILTRAQKDGRNLMILSSRVAEGAGDAVTLVAVNLEP